MAHDEDVAAIRRAVLEQVPEGVREHVEELAELGDAVRREQAAKEEAFVRRVEEKQAQWAAFIAPLAERAARRYGWREVARVGRLALSWSWDLNLDNLTLPRPYYHADNPTCFGIRLGTRGGDALVSLDFTWDHPEG